MSMEESHLLILLERALRLNEQYQQLAAERQIDRAMVAELSAGLAEVKAELRALRFPLIPRGVQPGEGRSCL